MMGCSLGFAGAGGGDGCVDKGRVSQERAEYSRLEEEEEGEAELREASRTRGGGC